MLLLCAAIWGCSAQAEIPIESQVLTVACGSCVFQMEGVSGCPWAAEVDGKHYLMRGPLPADHLTHAPDGICNMPRQARVDGFIRGDLLHVTRIELLDAENVPADPHFGPEDVH